MSESARRTFDAQDVLVAFTVALLAQLGLVAAFSLPSPKLVEADISDDNARPIAVAITPVLRLGTKSPTKLPTRWQRKQPLAAKSQGPTPSPQAEKTLEAIPKTNPADASVGPVVADAGKPELPLPTASEPTEGGSLAATSPIEGSEQGAANGTEVSPLKAIAADGYRRTLASWFLARFEIRGKIPFGRLKTLHSTATVTVTAERTLGSFAIVKPSGDTTFDAEVASTLSRIQSGGVELPAPPPMYPDLLGKSFPVSFQCTIEGACE